MNPPMPSQFSFVRDDVGQTFLPVHGFRCDLLSVCQVLTLLSALLSLSHLICTPYHKIGSIALFPFYQPGGRDSQRLNNSPKVPQLEAGKAGILTEFVCLRTQSLSTGPPTPPHPCLHLPFTSPSVSNTEVATRTQTSEEPHSVTASPCPIS